MHRYISLGAVSLYPSLSCTVSYSITIVPTHPCYVRSLANHPLPKILWAPIILWGQLSTFFPLLFIRKGGDPNLFMRWPTIIRGSNVSVRPPSHSINNSLSNQSRAINIHSFAHTIATGRLVMISTSYISFVQLDARPITYLPGPDLFPNPIWFRTHLSPRSRDELPSKPIPLSPETSPLAIVGACLRLTRTSPVPIPGLLERWVPELQYHRSNIV